MQPKLLSLLVLSVFIMSCKSEKQKVEENSLKVIRTYMEINLPKEIEGYKSLDSLKIIAIDSITEKLELNLPIEYALNRLKRYNSLAELSMEIAKNKQTIANLGSSLYGGYVNELENESAAEEIDKAKRYNDSAKMILSIANSLRKKQLTSDSTVLKYYAVKCLIQYTKNDLTFEKDTALVPVTKDFRVVEYKQIAKQHLGTFY